MRYTFLLAYLAGDYVYKRVTEKTSAPQPSRTVSSLGVALTSLEEGGQQTAPLIMSNPADILSFLQKLYAVLGPAAWVDYFAEAASTSRQFRATYIIFNAFFDASNSDDDKTRPHFYFFWLMFIATLVNIGISSLYVFYHRWNNIPNKVSNAYWLTEFLETVSAVYGIGSLIQDPEQTGDVSSNNQWLLIAFAFGLAFTQIITGIKGKSFFQDTAHNMIEAFGRPDESSGPVTLCERISYGTLRLLHTTHILTLAYSFSDALTLLFQANSYLDNPLNALICAVPITVLYLVESRLVLFALYSKKLPSWSLKVAMLGCCLYALNNAFFALNAFAFFVTLSRLNIENIDGSIELYRNFYQSLTFYLPSLSVAAAVFIIAWKEYHENFYNELNLRARVCGYNQKESDAVLDAFYIDSINHDPDVIISSKVAEFHHEQEVEEVHILTVLTGPLILSEAKNSTVFRSSDLERDSWSSVSLSEGSRGYGHQKK